MRDPDVSLAFYRAVFGVEEYYQDDESIRVKGPGPPDITSLSSAATPRGEKVASTISGFACTTPDDMTSR